MSDDFSTWYFFRRFYYIYYFFIFSINFFLRLYFWYGNLLILFIYFASSSVFFSQDNKKILKGTLILVDINYPKNVCSFYYIFILFFWFFLLLIFFIPCTTYCPRIYQFYENASNTQTCLRQANLFLSSIETCRSACPSCIVMFNVKVAIFAMFRINKFFNHFSYNIFF